MDIGPGLNRSDRTGGASNNGKSPRAIGFAATAAQ
jgi:hypothetical protein